MQPLTTIVMVVCKLPLEKLQKSSLTESTSSSMQTSAKECLILSQMSDCKIDDRKTHQFVTGIFQNLVELLLCFKRYTRATNSATFSDSGFDLNIDVTPVVHLQPHKHLRTRSFRTQKSPLVQPFYTLLPPFNLRKTPKKWSCSAFVSHISSLRLEWEGNLPCP